MSKKIVISLMAIICLVNIAAALEPPIYIGAGNSSDIVDGDKVWLAGDDFATTPLSNWNFGTNYEYVSPDPAPAEVYDDSYHKNSWCDLDEYDEISVPVANGIYLVRLHMFSNNTTHRKMDVTIEDVLVLDDYDPQAEAVLLGASTGANAIVIPEVIVEVSDGNGMQIRDSAGDMGGGCSDTWLGAVEIHLSRDPALAYNPTPEDESTDVSYDVILTWTPGAYTPAANGHIVYFSDNFDDVNDGVGGVTQDANSYDPGRLEFGVTYFWRIDDVNSSDSTVATGGVWSFIVESLAYPISSERITATASSNEDGKDPQNTVNEFGLDPNDLHSSNVTKMWLSNMNDQGPVWIKYELNKVYMLHEMLIWNYNGQSILSMFGLRDVTIEYSTDDSEWTTLTDVPEVNMATGTEDYTYNTTVAFDGAPAKFVKITASSNWSNGLLTQYGLSEVRFMYIPTDARFPFPEDGATDIALDTTLGWMPGRDAAEHNLYFSDDEQSVIDGTVSAQTISDASYGPLSLDLGSIYYWRVDEVNSTETNTTWQGNVWNFTTQEYLVVDDFEDYNDFEPYTVWNTWSDGYGIATNGSSAGYPNPNFTTGEHFIETRTAHSGKQSMPLLYDNTGSVNNSEVTRIFGTAQDWTRAGINTLTLYVYGQAGNAGGQLYVKINGIEQAVDVDLTSESWQELKIELGSIGTNLQRVTSLAISIRGAGSGMVFVDDILVGSPLE